MQANCCVGVVGAKPGLAAYPIGAFAGDGALGEFVAEVYFKFRTVEIALPVGFEDDKLAAFFVKFIGSFGWHEGRCREDELQGIDLLQFGF